MNEYVRQISQAFSEVSLKERTEIFSVVLSELLFSVRNRDAPNFMVKFLKDTGVITPEDYFRATDLQQEAENIVPFIRLACGADPAQEQPQWPKDQRNNTLSRLADRLARSGNVSEERASRYLRCAPEAVGIDDEKFINAIEAVDPKAAKSKAMMTFVKTLSGREELFAPARGEIARIAVALVFPDYGKNETALEAKKHRRDAPPAAWPPVAAPPTAQPPTAAPPNPPAPVVTPPEPKVTVDDRSSGSNEVEAIEPGVTNETPFKDIYPLDFELVDDDDHHALAGMAEAGQRLRLRIDNVAGEAIGFPKLGRGHHLTLRIPRGILKNVSAIALGDETAREWALTAKAWNDGAGRRQASTNVLSRFDALNLKRRRQGELGVQASWELTFEKVTTDGARGARNTRVEFDYRELTYHGRKLVGQRAQVMSVVNAKAPEESHERRNLLQDIRDQIDQVTNSKAGADEVSSLHTKIGSLGKRIDNLPSPPDLTALTKEVANLKTKNAKLLRTLATISADIEHLKAPPAADNSLPPFRASVTVVGDGKPASMICGQQCGLDVNITYLPPDGDTTKLKFARDANDHDADSRWIVAYETDNATEEFGWTLSRHADGESLEIEADGWAQAGDWPQPTSALIHELSVAPEDRAVELDAYQSLSLRITNVTPNTQPGVSTLRLRWQNVKKSDDRRIPDGELVLRIEKVQVRFDASDAQQLKMNSSKTAIGLSGPELQNAKLSNVTIKGYDLGKDSKDSQKSNIHEPNITGGLSEKLTLKDSILDGPYVSSLRKLENGNRTKKPYLQFIGDLTDGSDIVPGCGGSTDLYNVFLSPIYFGRLEQVTKSYNKDNALEMMILQAFANSQKTAWRIVARYVYSMDGSTASRKYLGWYGMLSTDDWAIKRCYEYLDSAKEEHGSVFGGQRVQGKLGDYCRNMGLIEMNDMERRKYLMRANALIIPK